MEKAYIRKRLIHVALLLVALVTGIAPASAQAFGSEAEGIHLEVPVLPGFSRYVGMLEYPSYLALALENNGLSPSLSSRMIIEDSRKLRLRNATFQYKGKQGTTYTYEAGVTLDLGITETGFSFPVIVDASSVPEGKVIVRAVPPLAKLFPRGFIDAVEIKARMLADAQAQQKVLEYLDSLSKKGSVSDKNLFDAILIDAYNRASASPMSSNRLRDRGEAEPLSDQILLLITLVIWLVIVPLAIAGRHFWRRRRDSRRQSVTS